MLKSFLNKIQRVVIMLHVQTIISMYSKRLFLYLTTWWHTWSFAVTDWKLLSKIADRTQTKNVCLNLVCTKSICQPVCFSQVSYSIEKISYSCGESLLTNSGGFVPVVVSRLAGLRYYYQRQPSPRLTLTDSQLRYMGGIPPPSLIDKYGNNCTIISNTAV